MSDPHKAEVDIVLRSATHECVLRFCLDNLGPDYMIQMDLYTVLQSVPTEDFLPARKQFALLPRPGDELQESGIASIQDGLTKLYSNTDTDPTITDVRILSLSERKNRSKYDFKLYSSEINHEEDCTE